MMLVSKPDDIYWSGFQTVKTVEKINPMRHQFYRLDPPYEMKRFEFARAIAKAWDEGGWTVYFDEAYYVQHTLGLEASMIKLLTQGRSNHISVVLGVQRPAWVTRFALSEPDHVFCFHMGDKRDLKTLGEAISSELEEVVPTLKQYEFAYHNKRTGVTVVADAKRLKEGFGEPRS